jgi:DNA primase
MPFKYGDILEELGITKTPREDGEIHIACPMHDDGHPSFDVNADNGLWWCRSQCGTGNIAQLVMGILGVTYKEAMEWLSRRLGETLPTYDDVYAELQKIRALMEQTLEIVAEYEYKESFDGLEKTKWPTWWPERGFDVDDWEAWDVYFDPANGDAVVPVYDMVGIKRGIIRRKPKDVLPKYWYPREFHKSQYLFGEDHCYGRDHVYVVEGPLDAIWMNHMGFPAVAIMGSSLSKEQYWRLMKMKAKRVTMVLDNDTSGIKGMMGAIENGTASGFDFVLLPEGKDPNDIKDKTELQTLLDKTLSPLELLIVTQHSKI